MLYVIKGLWYEYKMRKCEKFIMKMQKLRNKIKARQSVATQKMEKYQAKANAHKANG